MRELCCQTHNIVFISHQRLPEGAYTHHLRTHDDPGIPQYELYNAGIGIDFIEALELILDNTSSGTLLSVIVAHTGLYSSLLL